MSTIEAPANQGLLSGVHGVDLTTVITGPLATMMLADQGADVIKIESSKDGDVARHVATRRGGVAASFLNNNRNKPSVALDLKADEGIGALTAIIATDDASISSL